MAVLPFNIPGFNPKVTGPRGRFPAGATDCHAHVFGDRAKYGYADNRLYTPPPVVLDDAQRRATKVRTLALSCGSKAGKSPRKIGPVRQ